MADALFRTCTEREKKKKFCGQEVLDRISAFRVRMVGWLLISPADS